MIETAPFVELAHNASLLLAIAMIFAVIISRQKSARLVGRMSKSQVPTGILIGSIGLVIMLSPWILVPGVVFDTRSVLLSISGVFFGTVPTVLAMAMTAALRIALGGSGTLTGVLVITATGSLGILWRHRLKKPLDQLNFKELYLFGVVIHLVMMTLMLTLPWPAALRVLSTITLPVMVIYPLGTALLGSLMANLLRREILNEKIIENEHRFSIVANYTLDWEFWLSPQGTFLFCSPSCRSITGYAPEEFMQKAELLYEIVHPGDYSQFLHRSRSLFTGETGQVEFRIQHRDGSVRWMGLACTPIYDSEGAFLGTRGSSRDITERVQALQVLRTLAESRHDPDQDFYRFVIEKLATTLNRRFILAAQLTPHNPSTARTLAAWRDGQIIPNFEFEMNETPAVDVLRKAIFVVNRGARSLFPRDPLLAELSAESYWGAALTNSANQVIGLLALIDDQPSKEDDHSLGLLRSFAVRLASEIERQWAEEELLRSQKQTSDLVEFLPDAILGIDAEHRISIWNRAMEQLTGISGAEMLGQPCRACTPHLHGSEQTELLERVGSETPAENGLYHAIRHDGETLSTEEFYAGLNQGRGAWILARAAPLRGPDGAVTGAIEVLRDVTERRLAEDAVRSSQAQLQELLQEAEQSRQALLSLVEDQQRAQSEIQRINTGLEQKVKERTAELEAANHELEAFSYSVSHDLRAPLRTIDGFANLLIEDFGSLMDQKARHYLDLIQQSSMRMQMLIDDLLNLSRLTRTQLNLTRINLTAMALDVLNNLIVQFPQQEVECEVAENLEVEGDQNLLQIALENLFNNAIKFSSKRQKTHITFGAVQQDGRLVYYVQDNGAGFDMAYANKLFSPFQRLHRAVDYPGTGIGLVTVQRIIKRHGGRVWAESKVDQGATFYFTLGGLS